ncbi:hypothetical protein AB6N24_17845 [Cellulomonas sp. 179-A 4D5 NHS]|uniref:hypothetical protein n=1 Tax=Cellulomonas sp. 179-A 4D5 NHS TaxID=3142378 RepID=UPI0039A028A3
MGPLPVDVEVRLARAAQLLAELEQLCLAYLMNTNRTTDVTPLPDQCAYLVRSHVDPPPAIIGAVFGDLLNNYRSILDYIARNLVVTAGLTPIDGGPGSTMFPIQNTRPRNGRVDVPPGLPTEVREAVDGLQPYATTNADRAHPLAELSELNNRDKHRLLNVAALSEGGNVVFVPRDVVDLTITEDMRRYPLKVMPGKDQVVTVHPDDLFPDAQARGTWSATVVLEEADGAWSGQLLGIGRCLGLHIADEVIPRLSPYMSRADSQPAFRAMGVPHVEP